MARSLRLLGSVSSFVQWRCSQWPIGATSAHNRQFSTGALLRDKVTNVIVSPDKKTISLEFDGARQHCYHAVWLRHTCKCAKCWSSSSNQSIASPLHVLPTCTLKDAKVEGDALVVSWTEEHDPDHVGLHPLTWLKENAYDVGTRTLRHTSARPTPLKGKMKDFQFSEVMFSDEKRLEWLMALYEDGLTMVRNVPLETGRVRDVAHRIGNVQQTFYGETTVDVVSVENPVNVAYSSSNLYLHQDMQYYESPPGIQLLHCLKFDSCVEGGESTIVDMFYFAEQFCIQHPEEFNVLCRVNSCFYKVNFDYTPPAYCRNSRPVIVTDHDSGEIKAVHWNPYTDSPLCADPQWVEPFFDARWKFAHMLETFPYKHEFRLTPGDLIVFNNRRMSHARNAFSLNGGQRHLQGCYVNIDDFRSAVEGGCLAEGRPLHRVRVGNQDI